MDLDYNPAETAAQDDSLYYTPGVYEVTINPKCQRLSEPNRGYKVSIDIATSLDNLVYPYYFIMELSEPHFEIPIKSEGPRWHCHGCIMLRNNSDVYSFLNSGMRSILQGTSVYIKKITEVGRFEQWNTYCNKMRVVTNFAFPFGRHPEADILSEGHNIDMFRHFVSTGEFKLPDPVKLDVRKAKRKRAKPSME